MKGHRFFNFYIIILETMILQNSFDSTQRQSQTARAVKTMLRNAKEPLLMQIEQLKTRFHMQIVQPQTGPIDAERTEQSNRPPSTDTPNSISSKCPSQNNLTQAPRILTQSSCEEYIQVKQEPFIGEWTLDKGNTSVFDKAEDMVSYYQKVFDQRIQFARSKTIGGDSFKLEEKNVISEIYTSICNIEQQTVSFDAIHGFFEQCPLFYRIYNIHPNSLRDVLSDSAHCFESKLTKEQFMNLFLLNNRQNYEYETYVVDKTIRRCVLEDESWKDLKEIFDLFDTFGNETIQLKSLLNKLKTNSRYTNLLNKQVIEFPTINRSYTLKKILFEIEHKLQISQNYLTWEQVRSVIEHFRHIRLPTIDAIQKEKISSGVFTSFTNSYMLRPEVLAHIKDVFSRCPKYCSDFVKITHFCSQMLESQKTNSYLNDVVRNQPETVTFKHTLTQMANQNFKHLDLDEVLQWFSIRGLEGYSNPCNSLRQALSVQSSSSEQEAFKKIKSKVKANKNIQNLSIKNFKSNSREATVLKEFNLSKKAKESIRDKKVQQMIQESQKREAEEISKKFKANPIPASINNQKYQEYLKRTAQAKEVILQKLNPPHEKDKLVLQYLQANTKLFQRPKSVEPEKRRQHVFKAEPIPWFVYTDLLDQINEKKEAKRKEIKKQNTLKYLKGWKNLPSFLMENTLGQSAAMTNNHTQKTLFNELKLNEQGLKSPKRKVKEVPNFKLLQQQFLSELEQKKRHYNPTAIKEFNLSSPRIRPNIEEQTKEIKQNKINHKPKPSSSSNFIGSTLKFQALIRLHEDKKILEEIQRQQMLEKQLKRDKDRQLFAKLVRKQLSRQLKKSKKHQSNKNSRVKSQVLHSKREIANMYERVFSRPFLFQSASSRQKESSAEKRAETIQMVQPQESQIEYIEDCLSEQMIQNMLRIEREQCNSEPSQKSF